MRRDQPLIYLLITAGQIMENSRCNIGSTKMEKFLPIGLVNFKSFRLCLKSLSIVM